MKNPPSLPTYLLPLVFLAFGTETLRAAPFVIDEFSDDLPPVTTDSYLDGTMLGGELDISISSFDTATFEINGGVGMLSGVTETGGANNIQLIYDGNDGANPYAFDLPSVDLTDGGTNDRFVIDLASVTGTIDVYVRVSESSGNFWTHTISGVTSPGVLQFPFADFTASGSGADFAAAKQVGIFVFADTGEGFGIDSIAATGPGPIVIDEFSDELAPVTSSTSLNGAMLGGELDIDLDFLDAATFEITGGVGTLSGVTEAGEAEYAKFIYDGDDGSDANAYGLPSIDVTDTGFNDRFAIDLTSVTGSIDVLVKVSEDLSNFSALEFTDVTSPGILEFPFADFTDIGAGGDLTAAKQVEFWVSLETEEGFAIDSFRATVAAPAPPVAPSPPAVVPDTTRPTIGFLKKSRLKTSRTRHTLKGTVSDDGAIDRVEVKSSGRGWRKAKLKSSGRWTFRTPRLEPGNNVFKIRSEDVSGNRSKIKRLRPKGR